MGKPASSKLRWGLLLISLGVFLPLTIFVGWLPLWMLGYGAFQTRHWTPVQARIVSAELVSPERARVAKEVRARYEYEWKQIRYTGERISMATQSADGFGEWQRDMYTALKDAEIAGKPVSIWVNPEQPQQSVIQREPRPELLVFHGLSAFALTLITGLGIWGFFRMGLASAKPSRRARKTTISSSSPP
jgi:Protein of unknown function (DUF3592)